MTLNGPAANVLAGRRDAVLEALRETRAVLVLPAVVESVYSADVHYPYRTGSNIRYLTGFEEPAAVILSAAGHEDGFTLLVNPRDPVAETWTGRRAGIEGALSDYSADHAYPLDQFEEVVQKHLSGADRLYYGYGTSAAGDRIIPELVHRANGLRPRGGGSPIEMVDAGTILDEMRLFKADEEIAIMRRACEISSDAHVRLMEQIRPGMNEYQAQALIEHAFRDAGCAGPAYGTIAAGGANATVLHTRAMTANSTVASFSWSMQAESTAVIAPTSREHFRSGSLSHPRRQGSTTSFSMPRKPLLPGSSPAPHIRMST